MVSPPLVEDDLPEDDGVLHEGEEDEQHAGQQPHLQRRHRVGHRDPGPDITKLQFRRLFLVSSKNTTKWSSVKVRGKF